MKEVMILMNMKPRLQDISYPRSVKEGIFSYHVRSLLSISLTDQES